MAAASMFQGRSSSHRARIEDGACLLSDFRLACCLCMPAKSERIRLSYLTNSRIAAFSPPSVSGYIRRCQGPSSVARSLCPGGANTPAICSTRSCEAPLTDGQRHHRFEELTFAGEPPFGNCGGAVRALRFWITAFFPSWLIFPTASSIRLDVCLPNNAAELVILFA